MLPDVARCPGLTARFVERSLAGMRRITIALATLAALATACGGKPPKTADDTTTTSTTPPTGEDMPASPSTAGPSTASTAATVDTAAPTTAAPPAAPAIKIVALKLMSPPKDAKKAGFKAIEVKDDGSVLSDGKPVMKLVGNELQDAQGTTVYAIAADGSVTGAGGAAVGKFGSGDELTLASGAKLVVSDDGLIQMTDDKGKTTALGPKFESAPAWAKREAALLGLSFAAAPAGGSPSTAAKPAATKPAGKKK